MTPRKHNTAIVSELFLVSFLSLFCEILVIRLFSTEIRVFAYLKNVPLLSCFLGLGVGSTLASRKNKLYPLFPFLLSLVLLVVFLISIAPTLFQHSPQFSTEFYWSEIPVEREGLAKFGALLFVLFFLNALAFMSIGQRIGMLIRMLPPLRAYTINICGSLGGIWVFSLLSFFSLPPFFWILPAILLCVWLLREERVALAWSSPVLLLVLTLSFVSSRADYWSPYYKIHITDAVIQDGRGQPLSIGYEMDVNTDYHQRIINLSNEFVSRYGHTDGYLQTYREYYDLPYLFGQPRKVLILGAGGGNDVASALRHGVDRIDAVEIDPVILRLGHALHPEQPYQQPQVRVFTDDARAFFRQCQEKYDLIVYGLLDSHTLLSENTNLRLDNYVYTLEGFQEAKTCLAEKGVVALSFSMGDGEGRWILRRIDAMLRRVFGRTPLRFSTGYDGGLLFLVGEGTDPDAARLNPVLAQKMREASAIFSEEWRDGDSVPTDDWPFLYLKKKGVAVEYWAVFLAIFFVTWVMIATLSPRPKRVEWTFFFLGGAFFLVEVKNIAQLALLFGTTWVVSAIAISGILCMILLANWYASKVTPKGLTPYYVLLGLSLAVNYLAPPGVFLPMSLLPKLIFSCFLMSLPLFFAGVIFAQLFRQSPRPEISFGSNLLGSILGGFFEYGSLAFGINSLNLLAFLVYGAAYLCKRGGG